MFGKMDEPPTPPEKIPKYVREGIDRQGVEALEAIVEYSHARIELA